MKYLMFVCTDTDTDPVAEADREAAPEIEDWFGDVEVRGKWVTGDRLRPITDATTVRVRSGELLVTDGPFTESKECVVGFDVLECDDLDEALEIAARHPMAYGGRIEVRPFWPIDGD
ncbi:MAG: YciI family protein [Propionibacteriaceae bacterium]